MATPEKEELIVDDKFIKQYWDGKKLHKNYFKAIDVAYHLQFHFDGYFSKPFFVDQGDMKNTSLGSFDAAHREGYNPYFTRLIDERRPSESVVTQTYRRRRYQPITKEPCGKVINSLRKITKSADWHIVYDKSEIPVSLPKEDSLENYCENNYPKDDSLENWARKSLIRWMLIDPNGIICVFPLSWEIENNEYIEPYAHIIQSKDIYDFKDGEYAVFLSPYCNTYMKDGKEVHGKIIMVVTEQCFYEAKETGKEQFTIEEHRHNIGELPAWIIGGEMKNTDIKNPFYESFVHPMLPYLDNAAIDSSDLDAEKVQHLYSTMWFMQSSPCSNCAGIGNVLKEGKQTICPSCQGRGGAPFSPYRNIEVNLNSNGLSPDKQVPIPPAGYIEKSTEMVSKMMEIIDGEKYSALAAINFEFLANTPLNQSGKAKEVDKDELNNFVYGIASHLVEECLKPIYWFINEQRYMNIVSDKKTREKMLPQIPIPENYDFLTSRDAEDNLIKIAGSNVSEDLKDIAEMTYIHAKYQDEPALLARLQIIHDHDPFPEKKANELQALVSSGLVKKEDAILSLYIKVFVAEKMNENVSTDEVEENDAFVKLEYDEQHQVLMDMAIEKMGELDAQNQIKKIADAKTQAKADKITGALSAGIPGKIPAKKINVV